MKAECLKERNFFLGLILGNFLPHWDPIATGEPVCDPETPLLCPKKPTYIGNLLKIEWLITMLQLTSSLQEQKVIYVVVLDFFCQFSALLWFGGSGGRGLGDPEIPSRHLKAALRVII